MNTTLDNTYDALAWGSHLPALLACLAATEGPVIELGVGHFSTPALHAFCTTAKRRLVSIEDVAEWHKPFADKFTFVSPESSHLIINTSYDEAQKQFAGCAWGVAFIDNSPGGERRKKDFQWLLPLSDFVVVHDYHRENEEAISPLLPATHSWAITQTYQPPTLVASLTQQTPTAIFRL